MSLTFFRKSILSVFVCFIICVQNGQASICKTFKRNRAQFSSVDKDVFEASLDRYSTMNKRGEVAQFPQDFSDKMAWILVYSSKDGARLNDVEVIKAIAESEKLPKWLWKPVKRLNPDSAFVSKNISKVLGRVYDFSPPKGYQSLGGYNLLKRLNVKKTWEAWLMKRAVTEFKEESLVNAFGDLGINVRATKYDYFLKQNVNVVSTSASLAINLALLKFGHLNPSAPFVNFFKVKKLNFTPEEIQRAMTEGPHVLSQKVREKHRVWSYKNKVAVNKVVLEFSIKYILSAYYGYFFLDYMLYASMRILAMSGYESDEEKKALEKLTADLRKEQEEELRQYVMTELDDFRKIHKEITKEEPTQKQVDDYKIELELKWKAIKARVEKRLKADLP